jgi:hypothetical protein
MPVPKQIPRDGPLIHQAEGHVPHVLRIRVLRLLQQLFNPLTHPLLAVSSLPIQFTVPPVTNVPTLVDQIHTGPHGVSPGIPILLLRVHQDGKCQLGVNGFLTDIIKFTLARDLWRVHAQNDQASSGKGFMPTPVPGVVAFAVDSGEGIEVQSDYFALQLFEAQRR